jgi:TDG/mug DNA glycosylase family protein
LFLAEWQYRDGLAILSGRSLTGTGAFMAAGEANHGMQTQDTLPDYLRPGLDIVSIGLNPSLPSVRRGYYFANPRNRFWRALNASGLVPVALEPGVEATELMLRRYGIGFTDVVKRPTAGGGELRAADYRAWAPVLKERLLEYAPAIAWFHGKQAFGNYLKYAEAVKPAIGWGPQDYTLGRCRFFVTPNPSPANAVFSLADLTGWYRQLAAWRDGGCAAPRRP